MTTKTNVGFLLGGPKNYYCGASQITGILEEKLGVSLQAQVVNKSYNARSYDHEKWDGSFIEEFIG